jgi:KDO2-lipid IV(A) lauroyltransferase
VTPAHAWLHQRSGAPIIPAHCEPLPRGRYRIVFHPPLVIPEGATLRDVAQACWDAFEPIVRARPAPWLWMYKHWRYRPVASDAAEYPFYAGPHQRVDRMLARP